jgi:hypothetical protein
LDEEIENIDRIGNSDVSIRVGISRHKLSILYSGIVTAVLVILGNFG